MTDKLFTREQILTILSADPARITELTAGLTRDQLHTTPSPGEWSANEVLAHLRACSDVWGGSIKTILSEDMPAIKAINPRTWMKRTDYLEQEFYPSLDAFINQRNDLLKVLRSLPPESWDRTAMVTAWGRVYEKSLAHYADSLARHERSHVRQIQKIVETMHLLKNP